MKISFILIKTIKGTESIKSVYISPFNIQLGNQIWKMKKKTKQFDNLLFVHESDTKNKQQLDFHTWISC